MLFTFLRLWHQIQEHVLFGHVCNRQRLSKLLQARLCSAPTLYDLNRYPSLHLFKAVRHAQWSLLSFLDSGGLLLPRHVPRQIAAILQDPLLQMVLVLLGLNSLLPLGCLHSIFSLRPWSSQPRSNCIRYYEWHRKRHHPSLFHS